jgi:hypothetical protein
VKAPAALILTAAAVLVLASTEAGTVRADDWWQRTRVIPANTQMQDAPPATSPSSAQQISPMASPLRRPVDPEFCEHYGYRDPDECAREWANYLAHLPY